jgi:arylsulfatase A-like enzyme
VTRRGAWAALALLVVGLPLGACGRSCGRPRPATLYDLAERLWLADRSSPGRDVVLFGTPSAERHALEGFTWELDGSSWAWAEGKCVLAFEWSETPPRRAVLDLEASPGNEGQGVEVVLNQTAIGALDLEKNRTRYELRIPSEAQRVGTNRMAFSFRKTSPLSAGDLRQSAARFFGVTIGPEDDGGVAGLTARESPPVFGEGRGKERGTLAMVGPASARYALSLPERAALRFTPDLVSTTRKLGQSVEFRVTLESESGGERVLWRRVLGPRDGTGEVVLPLEGRPGSLVRLGLHIGGRTQDRFVWGLMRAPRVEGSARVGDLLPPPAGAGGSARTSEVAARLQNVNVVLVILDAARAGHFGCYGYGRRTTPEIDRIASDGVVFDRAYTVSVNTLGGMSSVWTSQYPDAHHHGVQFLEPLPTDRPTLAEWLSGRGVKTLGVVANAMAGNASWLDRGFGEFREAFVDKRYGSRAEVFRAWAHPWLAEHKRERFFAYLHFREPHSPLDPPDSFMEMFGPNRPLKASQRIGTRWFEAVNSGEVRPTSEEIEHLVRLYDGNLAYADREVGALRACLEREGLWERTLLIVAADHGEQLYEDGYIGHSAQVREESARIPLIIHFPVGLGPRGVRVKELVDSTDLAPTVAELFGGQGASAPTSFQGQSLLPVIEGRAGKAAVLVRTVWERPVYALVSTDTKLVYNTRTGDERLFFLTPDPDERHDGAAENPVRASFYRQSLHAWLARLAQAPRANPGGLAVTREECRVTREQCQNLCALGYLDCADCANCR